MEDPEKFENPSMSHTSPKLADDILRGADQIAAFLFGDPKERRKVYHLVESSHLPHFRLGAIVCARKSRLIQWIEQQEARVANSDGK